MAAWGNRRRTFAGLSVGVVLALTSCTSGSPPTGRSNAVSPAPSSSHNAASSTWSIDPVLSSKEGPCAYLQTSTPPTSVCSADGKESYVVGSGLTGKIVESATVAQNPAAASQTLVDLVLIPSVRDRLRQMTSAAAQASPQGELAIELDGTVLLAAQILGPINDGEINLCCFSAAQARSIAAGQLPR